MITHKIELKDKTDKEVMELYNKLGEIVKMKGYMLELDKFQDHLPDYILSSKFTSGTHNDRDIEKYFDNLFNKEIIKYVTENVEEEPEKDEW